MTLEPLLTASPVIQIHAAAAFIALGLGLTMWLRPKGTTSHKLIGRLFLVSMLGAAISSFWIRQINEGSLSWIHIFIPITLFASFEAVYYVRKGNVKRHKRAVQGMFFGALLIPGLFAMMPGRILNMALFG